MCMCVRYTVTLRCYSGSWVTVGCPRVVQVASWPSRGIKTHSEGQTVSNADKTVHCITPASCAPGDFLKGGGAARVGLGQAGPLLVGQYVLREVIGDCIEESSTCMLPPTSTRDFWLC